MFTGIIKHIGTVVSNVQKEDGKSLKVLILNLPKQEIGNSISVQGCCLTIVAIEGDIYTFYVSSETLKQTTLPMFFKGQKVNIETAMLASTPLGGHVVSGHIDEVCQIKSIEKAQNTVKIFVELSPKGKRLVVKKGSIAIDGTSLTIMNISGKVIELNIIPHTWENTTLTLLNTANNSLVNIEFDQMSKIIKKHLDEHFANI